MIRDERSTADFINSIKYALPWPRVAQNRLNKQTNDAPGRCGASHHILSLCNISLVYFCLLGHEP